MKYTAEEVRHCAKYINPSNPEGYSGMLTQATAMLTAYADSIERAQAGVTNEVVERACDAYYNDGFCPPVFGEARQTIVDSLRASKGWVTGYAEAFVDDFVAAQPLTTQGQGEAVSDNIRDLLAHVYGMGAAHGHHYTVEGGYTAYTRNEWRDAYREAIDTAIDEDAETFAALPVLAKPVAQPADSGRVGDISRLTRYFPSMPSHPGWQMTPDSCGEWVMFRDVQALLMRTVKPGQHPLYLHQNQPIDLAAVREVIVWLRSGSMAITANAGIAANKLEAALQENTHDNA